MSAAGLIKGRFTGVTSSGTTTTSTALMTPPGITFTHQATPASPGVNAPIGQVPRQTYTINSLGVMGDSNIFRAGNYNNIITVTAQGNVNGVGSLPGTAATPTNPILIAADAYDLDMKADDGQPGYGTVLATPTATCSSSATDYNIVSSSTACGLSFLEAFGMIKGTNQ